MGTNSSDTLRPLFQYCIDFSIFDFSYKAVRGDPYCLPLRYSTFLLFLDSSQEPCLIVPLFLSFKLHSKVYESFPDDVLALAKQLDFLLRMLK